MHLVHRPMHLVGNSIHLVRGTMDLGDNSMHLVELMPFWVRFDGHSGLVCRSNQHKDVKKFVSSGIKFGKKLFVTLQIVNPLLLSDQRVINIMIFLKNKVFSLLI